MRRNRLLGALAVTTVLMTGLGTQPALASPSTGRPKAGGPMVALTADRITTSGGEATTERFYRDSQGRTRVESGQTVTINDPATRTTIRLDLLSATFQRLAGEPQNRAATVRREDELAGPMRSLGEATLHGVRAQGREYTVTIPARGKVAARTERVTLWLSSEVQLAVRTRIVSGSVFEQSYENIKTGAAISADLFEIPDGFRAAAAVTAGTGTSASCPVENAPDPLVLNSYDFFWDAGYVTALTDAMAGCTFIADGAYFEYPLWGGPTTPIGLNYDQWVAFDTGGGGLPFLPYVAFGDIAFMAFNGSDDTTTKDSLVVLTVWCC